MKLKMKLKGEQVLIWVLCILITLALYQLPVFKG